MSSKGPRQRGEAREVEGIRSTLSGPRAVLILQFACRDVAVTTDSASRRPSNTSRANAPMQVFPSRSQSSSSPLLTILHSSFSRHELFTG